MRVIVVGAGIGGLSAAIELSQQGHSVVVLEDKDGLAEYGAGLQVSPNAVRLLHHWGVDTHLRSAAFVPQRTLARRYDTGEILGKIELNPLHEMVFGFPYWQVFRPDLQRALYKRAIELGAEVRFSSRVTTLDVPEGVAMLSNGERLNYDLVICADGIGSRTRSAVLGSEGCSPRALQDSNFRAMIPRSSMMTRPDTAKLISSDEVQLFMGPNCALLAYPVASGEQYNIAMTVIGDETADSSQIGRWNDPVSSDMLKQTFHDFCLEVQSLLDLVETCTKWTIAEVPTLQGWASSAGPVVLLGDAAHAMSPHLAQGACMAIEDAAVLGRCLRSASSSRDQVMASLVSYERMRRPRVERISELARMNGASMVLEDGPAQKQRDIKLNASLNTKAARTAEMLQSVEADCNATWPSPPLLKWLYGFDAFSMFSEGNETSVGAYS